MSGRNGELRHSGFLGQMPVAPVGVKGGQVSAVNQLRRQIRLLSAKIIGQTGDVEAPTQVLAAELRRKRHLVTLPRDLLHRGRCLSHAKVA